MEINKPISIIRNEFITGLTNLINESGLPAFIIEPILKDVYNNVYMIAQKQYEEDCAKYNEELEKQNQNEKL